MPRKKSPDARDEVMSARFSKAETEAIDKDRADTDRSVWLYRAALEKLSREPEPPRKRKPPVPETSPERLAAPVDATPGTPAPKVKDCKHPSVRVKGYCTDCETYAAGKS